MLPLDLTQRPPRSGYDELDGLAFMPRTIDKLRALLPGGNPGVYFINASIRGLSGVLLDRLGISEEDLQAVVASADTEDEIATWLRSHTDASKYASISTMMRSITLAQVTDRSVVTELYAEAITRHPELERLLDIIDADDRMLFNSQGAR